MPPIVLGITGASGAPYAVRLLEVLLRGGHEVHVTISPSGAAVVQQELSFATSLEKFDLTQWGLDAKLAGKLHYHHWRDFMTPIASGSFLTSGMVVCPCSGTTLSAIAAGSAGNLIQRAAEVHLKERRKLVLVPRETPVSLTHIDNMKRCTEAGAVILPASPGWYHGVKSLDDLINFVVARILDQLGVDNGLIKRWG